MSDQDLLSRPPKTDLLSRIGSPEDLKQLRPEQLQELAQEVRGLIIHTVSRTGGHLAPSLGVVELTIALHYVFNAPQDKIIWDVGHQAYAHKLLTGRLDRFKTLRQTGGLSGFPKRDESIYDCFDTGHASTSISAGLGMSVGKELKGETSRVVAVIGDGSMTGGMAYEGFNQAGGLDKDLIVVLNDNEMSISPNVGALSAFLSRQMTGRTYLSFKERFQNFLKSLPQGESLISLARRGEDSFKSFFTPGMLFEAFGFDYVGPINGHRLDRLIRTFQNVRHIRGPVLVHVLTTKGKGYTPAEENPTHFHGVGSFGLDQPPANKPRPRTYTEVFGRTMCRLAQADPKIVAITAAMPEGTGLNAFAGKFPERTFDVGIAEQHAVTFAAGLALEGFKPVVAIYSTFMQRAFDQILHDVCLQNLPLTLALDRGGLVGEDGPTHHGVFDLSYLRAAPNMVVMAPRDENQLQHMLKTAVEHPGPAALRYPRGNGPGAALDPVIRALPIGQAELLRQGKDVLLLAVGTMVYPALKAAERLAEWDVSAAVVDARFIKPLDQKLIPAWAQTCGRVVTLEENVVRGGFGSAVLELLAEKGLCLPVKLVGLPDRFVEHGSQRELRALLGLDADGITATVRDWIGRVAPRLRQVKA